MDIYIWVGFLVMIVGFLALDLGVFHKNEHVVSTKEAFTWTTVWVTVSLLFSLFVYYAYDLQWIGDGSVSGMIAATDYITGYLMELSLSMDNVFVIAVILSYFKIPKIYQHRVLFWGIIGALLFRGVMIGAGVALLHAFSWMMYVFGALLLYTAYKMLTTDAESVNPGHNPVIKFLKRFFPVTKNFYGDRFFIRKRKVVAATPLFVALMVIESTDVMFAVDSIPAIFGITTEPFLVFTSNIFAILGLRSLFFVLSSVMDKFKFMKYSLVFILAFVGLKMLAIHYVHLPSWASLLVIVVALTTGVVLSMWHDKKNGIEVKAGEKDH